MNKRPESRKLSTQSLAGFSFLLATSNPQDDLKTLNSQKSSISGQPGQKTEFLVACVGQKAESENENIQVLDAVFKNKQQALEALTQAAQNEVIVLLSEGLPVNLKEAERIYKESKPDKNNSIAVASGRLTNKNVKKQKTTVATRLGNLAVQVLTSLETSDNFSGMQLYPAALAKTLFSQKQLASCPKLCALNTAKQAGYKITEHAADIKRPKLSFGKTLAFIPVLLWLAVWSRINWFIIQPTKELGKKDHLPANRETDRGLFRLGFAAIFVLLLSTMLYVSKDYGISGDEWLQNMYGNEILDYFLHGDMSATKETGRIQSYDDIFYYSGGYELFYTLFTRAFPDTDPYRIRHFWNAFVGFLAIFFAALIGKSFGGWRMALIVLIIMAVSPRFFGHAMNNSKDVPFAFAYIMGVYFILEFVKRLPRISMKHSFFLAISIGLVINARIGGLLIIAYLFFFVGLAFLDLLLKKRITFDTIKAKFVPVSVTLVAVSAVGYVLGIIFWPYALLDPINHPLQSLSKMTDFHTVLGVLFEGQHITSTELPSSYILKWIFISIPEIVMLGAVVFAVLLFPLLKAKGNIPVALLLFSFLFPPLYAIYQESNVYDGWRHFIFIYPSLGAIAGIGLGFALEKWKTKAVQIAIPVIILIGITFPLRFMVANHPHQVTYFNDLNGGIKAAYGNYELDYYMNSLKPASMWLINEKALDQSADSTVVATNCWKELRHYFSWYAPTTKAPYTHYNRRSELEWDYAIFYTRFINRNLLLNAFPPAGTIHIEEADGVPLTVVVKRVSNEDFLGIKAMERNDFETALMHFDNYLQKDPLHEGILERAGLAALQTGDGNKAMQYLNHLLSIYPESFNGLYYAGIIQYQQNNLSDALIYLQRALDINPRVAQLYQMIGEIYERQGNSQRAQEFYRAAQSF